jgi:hypothetical protein
MNATLMKRPLMGLLLQPWSTATTQTKNNTIAAVARIFSNMIDPSKRPSDQVGRSSKEYCRKIAIGTVAPITPDRGARPPPLAAHTPHIATPASADT